MKSFLHITIFSKSQKCILYTIFLICFSSLTVQSQLYQQIAVTGFNHDVIANGAGSPLATTTTGIDGFGPGTLMYEQGYVFCSSLSMGLPQNGFITSASNPLLTYQLANYSANNALYLPNSGNTGQLNLIQNGYYSEISLLSFSTEGNTSMSVSFQFADGTTSASYDVLNVNDWYNGFPYAIAGFGRIFRESACNTDEASGNPRMYDYTITLSAGDRQKLITGINIMNTNFGRLLVMAVSGKKANVQPLSFNSISATPETCIAANNGTITVHYSGGIPPYSVYFTGLSHNYVATEIKTTDPYTLQGVAPDDYYDVLIRDSNGDEFSKSILVSAGTVMPAPMISASGPTSFCSGGSVGLSVTTAGKSLHFSNGNNAEAPSTPKIALTNALTIEAWVKPSNPYGGVQYIVSKSNNDQLNGQYGIYLNNGKFIFHAFENGHIEAQGNTSAEPDTWYHVAASWDGNTIQLYVNGILDASSSYTGTLTANTAPLEIGRLGLMNYAGIAGWNIPYEFYGEIDELRIWNTARTNPEIVANADKLLSAAANPSLVAYYHFEEGSGTTTADAANGNTATLNNYPDYGQNAVPDWANSAIPIVYQTYTWSPNGENTPGIQVGTAGTYSVTVTDQAGCTAVSEPVTITVNPLPTAVIVTNPSSCIGVQGSITLDQITGTGPFTFSFDGGLNYQPSASMQLPDGTYTLYIKDNNNCPVLVGTTSLASVADTEPPVFTQQNQQSGSVSISIPAGGSFSSWSIMNVFNFNDPLPQGAKITGVDLTYSAADQGWGFTGATNFMYVSGTQIGSGVINHDLYPGGQTFTLNYTGTIPGYVYGGVNTVDESFVNWPGWQFIWNGGTLTLHYTTSVTVNSNPNDCFATVTLTPPQVTDNCGIQSVTNDAPAIFPVGTTFVTWTATDISNNSATFTQTVTVLDKTSPVMVSPSNTSIDACTTTVPDFTIELGVSDNCTAPGSIVVTQSPVAGTMISPGETMTITLTATDASGNTATSSFDITRPVAVPTLVNDNATVCAGSSVVIHVLNNDVASCGVLNIGSNTQPSVGTLVKNPDNSFTYTAPVNYTGPVTFTYSTGSGNSVQKFSGNNHYYEYVPAYNLSWNNARDQAAAKTHHGLPGYLVTVTSAAEQAFISGMLGGRAWMGASDIAYEGVWRWVTGPEGLEDGGKGRHFSNQSQYDYAHAYTGQGINGAYVNWYPGEPNNYYTDVNSVNPTDINRAGEQYVVFYYDPTNTQNSHGYWNDAGSLNVQDNSFVDGYVVEYGGMGTETIGGDATASVTIMVNAITQPAILASSQVICIGAAVQLSVTNFDELQTYQWKLNGIDIANATGANYSATEAGNYSVTAVSSAGCSSESNSLSLTATDVTRPTVSWAGATSFCSGKSLLLTVSNPDDRYTYQWKLDGSNIPGATQKSFDASVSGNYTVMVSNGGGCTNESIAVIITVNPAPSLPVISGNNSILIGGTTQLSASVGGGVWGVVDISVINISNSGLVTGISVGSAAANYNITNQFGCSNSVTYLINVNGKAPSLICSSDISVNNSPGQNGAVVNFAVTDGKGIPAAVITYSKNPGSFFPIGNTTVTATATNPAGTASCTFTITVVDNEKPNIICSSSLKVAATSALGATVNYAIPTATDNSGTTTITLLNGLPSGSLFPIGLTTVTYRATDASGNFTDCSFVVSVVGVMPAVICPANITVNNTIGQCGTIVNFAAADSTGFPAASITYSVKSGTLFPVGTTTVLVTAANILGSTTCSFTVTVKDVEMPVLVTKNITATLDGIGQVTITPAQVLGSATDNCGVDAASYVLSKSSFDCSNIGPNTVTLTVKDVNGNSTIMPVNVLVQDNQLPVPVLADLPAISLTPNSPVPAPTATDNCAGTITAGSTDPLSYTNPGTYTIHWIYDDHNGNIATQIQTIHIIDIVPPNIICIPTIVQRNDQGICGAVVKYKIPQVTDNASSVAVSISEGYGDNTISFNTPFTKDVSNISFVSSGAFQDIAHGHGIPVLIAVDLFNPSTGAWTTVQTVQTDTGDYHFGGTTVNFPAISQVSKIRFTANQYIGAALHFYELIVNLNSINLVQKSGLPSGSLFPIGNTVNVFEATDESGNKNTCNFIVTVFDAEKPVIKTIASSEQNANANCSWTGSAATIAVMDGCNAGLILKEQYFDEKGNNFYTGVSGITTGTITLAARTLPLGTNKIYITVTDAAGNESEPLVFTVKVVDITAPTVTLSGNKTQVSDPGICGAYVRIEQPVVTDNCSVASLAGVRSDSLSLLGSFPVGVTTITWTVLDGSGNKTTALQTVTVTDNQGPVITRYPREGISAMNDAGSCGAVVTWPELMATDNCSGIASFSSDHKPGEFFPLGTTTVTYTAIDRYNNTSTVSFTVTVADKEAPTVITKPVTVTLRNGLATILASDVNGGSADNCGAVTLSVSKSSFTCADAGNNLVTLTVTDGYGNAASGTAVVTVVGQAPTSSVTVTPTSSVYTGGVPTDIYIGYGTSSVILTDNVTGPVPVSYSWTGSSGLSCNTCAAPVFTPVAAGAYTFQVTATNQYGCSTTSTVTICVRDIRVTAATGSKVYVCHTDLSTGIQTNLTLAVNAVANQLLQNPQDKLGMCGMLPCVSVAVNAAELPKSTTPVAETAKVLIETTVAITDSHLQVKASPNPTNNIFTLFITTGSKLPVQVRLLDLNGKTTESYTNVPVATSFGIGGQRIPGVYFAEILQGRERKVVKLIKQNR